MIAGGKSRFLLKRNGTPSTCEGVVDVFRLTKQKNVIGRQTARVDFYLNSSVNKCLISRQHAIIFLNENEDGVGLSIRDQGLNGTFVNDFRVQGTVQLKIGDTIIFGHTNGVAIKPGAHAPQPDSEFSFILQEISDNPSHSQLPGGRLNIPEVTRTPLHNSRLTNHQSDITTTPPTEPRYNTTSRPTTPGSSPQLAPTERTQLNDTPVSRKAAVSRVEPCFDRVTNQGREGMMVQVSGFSELSPTARSNQRNGELYPSSSPCGSVVEGGANNPSRSSPFTAPRGQHSNSSGPSTSASQPSGSSGSLQGDHRTSANTNSPLVYISPKLHSSTPRSTIAHRSSSSNNKPGPSPTSRGHHTPIPARVNPPVPSPTSRGQHTPIPARLLYGSTPPSSALSTPGSSRVIKTFAEVNARNVSRDSGVYDFDDTEDMAIDSDAGSDDDIFALASTVQDKMTNFTDDDDNFSPVIPDSHTKSTDDKYPNMNKSVSPLPGLNITRNSYNSMDVYSAGESSRPVLCRSASPVLDMVASPGLNRSASPVLQVLMPFGAKGTKLKVSTTNGGKRKLEKVNVYCKKPRPTPSNNKSAPVNVDIEVHTGKCSSIDCCQPQQKKTTVAWVQCDDCDGWYHVDCVGCSYNKVKQSTSAFHCGCL